MIRCLISDVDGVMTDGSITYDEHGNQLKTFHVRDGYAIKAWIQAGNAFAIITARGGEAIKRRAAELGIEHCVTNSKNKADDARKILQSLDVAPEEAGFIGDDLPDAPAIKLLGHSFAPADAASDILSLVNVVTKAKGGKGVLREIIELQLRQRNQWPAV